jgi:SGNH domain (fused to AT3 domains)
MLASLESGGYIRVVDVFDIFCPGEECGFFNKEGVLLYRDEWSHPSVDAAILARESLLAALGFSK